MSPFALLLVLAAQVSHPVPSGFFEGGTLQTSVRLAPSGGGAAWTPADLGADLALWLDADDASTITLNGSNVSQWSDKSGNARHVLQAAASGQPTFVSNGLNGKPTITFDGAGDILLNQNAGSVGVTNISMFMVTRYVTGSGEDLAMGIGQTGQLGGIRAFYRNNGSTTQGFAGWGRDAPASSLSTDIGGVHHIFEAVHPNSATVNLFRDGVAGTGNPYTLSGGGTVPVTFNGFSIGSLQGPSVVTYYSNIQTSEVIISYTALSTTDRQKLEGYLAWKWGLTYALPNGHPYKWDTSLFGGTNQDGFDADAKTYITAVETADGQDLEPAVREAINDFVVGCKADGIWDAIKASAILAGARTLTGALVPLKGTAPTNFNFVSGDYNRTTGLVGNGITKYLDSNRNNNADPQNSKHLALYQSSLATADSLLFATSNLSGRSALISFVATGITQRINSSLAASNNGNSVGFVGGVRTTSTATAARVGGADFPDTITSQVPSNEDIGVFATASGAAPTNARLAFYSIGEALDLAQLDARVTTLINAYAAEIP